MEFLAEDATYLAGGLGLLGAIFLIVLRVTQEGRYLVRALIALGLAALVVLIEWLWVTDNERIENVVEDLRHAVATSNAPGILVHLTPEVEYSQPGHTVSGDAARKFIENQLQRTEFDFVQISQLETHAGRQSGRGSAVFRVFASGTYRSEIGPLHFGTRSLDFSLGFQQTQPKVWQVDRINLTRPPREMPSPGGGGTPSKEVRPPFEFQRPPHPSFRKDRSSRKRFSIPVPSGEDATKNLEAPQKKFLAPTLEQMRGDLPL